MIYETIWERRTCNFRVRLEATEEPDPDLSWDETGETTENLRSGLWTNFMFRVVVIDRHGNELGTSYLGNSIYENASDFVDHRLAARETRKLRAEGNPAIVGSYFAAMVREAIRETRQLWNQPRATLRAV